MGWAVIEVRLLMGIAAGYGEPREDPLDLPQVSKTPECPDHQEGDCRRPWGRKGKCGERGCQGVLIGWRAGSSVPGPGEPPFLFKRQLLPT
jgi:hypothetical protein